MTRTAIAGALATKARDFALLTAFLDGLGYETRASPERGRGVASSHGADAIVEQPVRNAPLQARIRTALDR